MVIRDGERVREKPVNLCRNSPQCLVSLVKVESAEEMKADRKGPQKLFCLTGFVLSSPPEADQTPAVCLC